MMNKYGVIYFRGEAGVIRYEKHDRYSFVTTVDYTGEEARRMADALNANPRLDKPDLSELFLILEAA